MERVENVPLFERFLLNKKHAEAGLKNVQQVTRTLFHGTEAKFAADICDAGLNRSFAGSRGMVCVQCKIGKVTS